MFSMLSNQSSTKFEILYITDVLLSLFFVQNRLKAALLTNNIHFIDKIEHHQHAFSYPFTIEAPINTIKNISLQYL